MDIRKIRENPEWFENEIKKRFDEELLQYFKEFLKIDKEWRNVLNNLNRLRKERNEISEQINKAKKEGKPVEKLIERAKELPIKIKELESKELELNEKREELMLLLPNYVDDDVPIGDESKNQIIEYHGIPKVMKSMKEIFKKENPNAKYTPVELELPSHYDLVEMFDLVDSETAGKIAGSRFYIEKNKLVKLDLAIIIHALNFFEKKGFNNIVLPPYVIKHDVERKITHYDTFKDAIFHLKEDNLLLITTSEHPIAAMFMNKNIPKSNLPLRILAWSPAFRREAGSHGKDTKGIFRVKQFHKVELHSIVELEKDRDELQHLVECVKDYMNSLELPFRVVKLASGDMDKRARVQYDIETWFPSMGYRETHSIATIGDWISRKINIKSGNEHVANLYATGVAVQRMICAILENNFDPTTKSIKIPKVLVPYTKFETISLEETK